MYLIKITYIDKYDKYAGKEECVSVNEKLDIAIKNVNYIEKIYKNIFKITILKYDINTLFSNSFDVVWSKIYYD